MARAFMLIRSHFTRHRRPEFRRSQSAAPCVEVGGLWRFDPGTNRVHQLRDPCFLPGARPTARTRRSRRSRKQPPAYRLMPPSGTPALREAGSGEPRIQVFLNGSPFRHHGGIPVAVPATTRTTGRHRRRALLSPRRSLCEFAASEGGMRRVQRHGGASSPIRARRGSRSIAWSPAPAQPAAKHPAFRG